MAKFITADLDTFDRIIYGRKLPVSTEYLQRQRESFYNNSTPASAQFLQSAMEMDGRLRRSAAISMAKAAVRKVRSIWDSDAIRTLVNISDFQQAPDSMKRFIMAEPTTRALWQKQMCDGYGDVMEFERELSGEEVLEYRQVTDGIINLSPDDEEYEWECHSYCEEELEEDMKIITSEQMEILETWDNLKGHIEAGEEDPTSPDGGWL